MISSKCCLRVSAILSFIAAIICAPLVLMLFVTSIVFISVPDGRSQSDLYIGIVKFFLLWSIVWLVIVICIKTWLRAIFSTSVSSTMQIFGWVQQTIIAAVALIGFITHSGLTERNLYLVGSISTSLVLVSVTGLIAQVMQNKAAHTNPLPRLESKF